MMRVITLIVLLSINQGSFFLPAYAQVFEWANGIGASGGGKCYGSALDNAGNIYVIGTFSGTADFDPDSANQIFLSSNGDNDIFVAKYDINGNYLWAISAGSTGWDAGYSIAVDTLTGSIYVKGFFADSVDFDPGPGTFYLDAIGSQILFIAKYELNGGFLWAMQLAETSFDDGNSIAVYQPTGDVYVTGEFYASADFDPGPDTLLLSAGFGSESNFFIGKFSQFGDLVWMLNIGSPLGYEESMALALDDSGNVFVTGIFMGECDFDPGPDTFNLTSMGIYDIFLAKYSMNGTFLWAISAGSTRDDASNSITYDMNNNVIITGFIGGRADFKPGPDTVFIGTDVFQDIFIAKYDAAGNFVWAKNITNHGWGSQGNNIATDENGNIFVTGIFSDTADFNPDPFIEQTLVSNGGEDIFVTGYDLNGNYLWAFNFGAKSWGMDRGESMNIYPFFGEVNVFICGSFTGKTDFDPGPDSTILFPAGSENPFIAQYRIILSSITDNKIPIKSDIIYPNPASNYIHFWGTALFPAKVNLYDIQARKVLEKSIVSNDEPIDIRILPAGFYAYIFTDNKGGVYSGRMMVVK